MKAIVVLLVFMAYVGYSHTDAEKRRYVDAILTRASMVASDDTLASEGRDPDPNSVLCSWEGFLGRPGGNTWAGGWSIAERRAAFDWYLEILATTNSLAFSSNDKGKVYCHHEPTAFLWALMKRRSLYDRDYFPTNEPFYRSAFENPDVFFGMKTDEPWTRAEKETALATFFTRECAEFLRHGETAGVFFILSVHICRFYDIISTYANQQKEWGPSVAHFRVRGRGLVVPLPLFGQRVCTVYPCCGAGGGAGGGA